MIRVFWFNGGTFHEDVPDDQSRELIRHLRRTGFVVWAQRLIATR
jgi:hypothetical protein